MLSIFAILSLALNYIVFILGMALCITASSLTLRALFRWLRYRELLAERRERKRRYNDYLMKGKL